MVLILFVISHRFNLKKTPKNTQEYGISSPVWGHSLSTYEKFSTEPRFLNPVSFSENFAYVLNEWSFHQLSHVHKWQSILMIWFHFIGYSEQWQLNGRGGGGRGGAHKSIFSWRCFSWGWVGFWHDVFQTTAFHWFQQSCITIETSMFDNFLNSLIFLLKLNVIEMNQSIDKISRVIDSSFFCSHHLRLVLWKLWFAVDVYSRKMSVNFQTAWVGHLASN